MGMSEHRMNVYHLPQARRIEEPDPLPLVRVPRRPEVAPPRFGVGKAFRIFRLRIWTILTVVLVCTAAAGLILSQLTPLYSASALVVVGQQRTDAVTVDPLATDPAAETQLRVLQSTWLAERTIAALNLARDPEFTRDSGSPLDRLNPMSWFGAKAKIGTGSTAQNSAAIDPALLSRFASRLTVAAEGRSSVARVTFTSTNPVKAALIANTIVAAYLQTQTNAASAAPAVADEELVRLTQRVRETEAAIESQKMQAASAPAKDGEALAGEQLSELNTQISVARKNLAEHEGKHRRAVNLLTSGDDPATITGITSAPVIVKLRDKQTDLTRRETELSEKYGDRHPQMIAIRQERSALQAKIDDELKRIIKSLAGAVTAAKARLTSLETSLSEMQGTPVPASTARSDGGDQVALRELETELAARRAALEQHRATAQAPAATPANGSRIAGKATAPSEPSFPDTPMIMGGTLFGSTLIGMLFALVMESRGKGFRAGHEVERMAMVPNLAVVPDLKGVKHIADLIMQKPSSSFTEAVRTLYSGLQLSNNGDRPPKVVVMTSSLPHEGKTSLAVSLGRLASKGGARVILIDADLRHPSVGAAFSPRRPEAGLVEVLTGQRKLRDVLHRDPISPLEFIPTAAPAQSPLELLASPAMKNMMDILRQHYDLIIVDAAPVLPVSDTRLLSRIADKMVYVVGWNATPREAVVAGLRLLHDANADVAGTVLNQADMRRHAIYSHDSTSYGYGTKYARYHTQ
jgi:succinoglycan biosynthesis transport protein ExoP